MSDWLFALAVLARRPEATLPVRRQILLTLPVSPPPNFLPHRNRSGPTTLVLQHAGFTVFYHSLSISFAYTALLSCSEIDELKCFFFVFLPPASHVYDRHLIHNKTSRFPLGVERSEAFLDDPSTRYRGDLDTSPSDSSWSQSPRQPFRRVGARNSPPAALAPIPYLARHLEHKSNNPITLI